MDNILSRSYIKKTEIISWQAIKPLYLILLSEVPLSKQWRHRLSLMSWSSVGLWELLSFVKQTTLQMEMCCESRSTTSFLGLWDVMQSNLTLNEHLGLLGLTNVWNIWNNSNKYKQQKYHLPF